MLRRLAFAATLCTSSLLTTAQAPADLASGAKSGEKVVVQGSPAAVPPPAAPADSTTDGVVHVGGQLVNYRAIAGTLTVGATDAQDATLAFDGKLLPEAGVRQPDREKPEEAPPTARIFYAAYFKKTAPGEVRPVTFLYNGGPGSSTMWLHMGSFGPRRVVTTDAQHDTAAPYRMVENQYSLLDATDLVFIDAPGTGFSRIMGKDAAKAFWGTDQDAHAFDRFVRRFLTKYNRWNSPKYLFGESYGTTRSAVLSNILEDHLDLNGVMLLSQIFNFDITADGPGANPGTDIAYVAALPSFAATAWYHKKVPNQPAELLPFLKQVEEYTLGEYASALLQGSDLPPARKQAVAEKLNAFTGIPAAYWTKANLRMSGAQFSQQLLGAENLTVGRLDSRYQGPAIDPLSSEAEYDPFTNSISSAFNAAINSYVRNDLKYGEQATYMPSAYALPGFEWELRHAAPGGGRPDASVNVMSDLASAMKHNPRLKVMLMGGYFDLGTLYFGSVYEMKHLPMPASLEDNISYHFFPTGHMVYINEEGLKGMHEYASAFIRSTQNGR